MGSKSSGLDGRNGTVLMFCGIGVAVIGFVMTVVRLLAGEYGWAALHLGQTLCGVGMVVSVPMERRRLRR